MVHDTDNLTNLTNLTKSTIRANAICICLGKSKPTEAGKAFEEALKANIGTGMIAFHPLLLLKFEHNLLDSVLIFTEIAEAFQITIWSAFLFSFQFLCFPLLASHLWLFIIPGCYCEQRPLHYVSNNYDCFDLFNYLTYANHHYVYSRVNLLD